MDYEVVAMQLIVNGGNARSSAMEAIRSAKLGDIAKARRLYDQACEALSVAHDFQTQLIQEEASGNNRPVSILMVHAQDHLMNAIIVKDLALEIIDLYEKMDQQRTSNSKKITG